MEQEYSLSDEFIGEVANELQATNNPYCHLWQAVLIQALRDANGNINDRQAKLDKRHARAWLTSYSPDFNWVCNLAGIVPAYALERFREYFNQRERTIKMQAAEITESELSADIKLSENFLSSINIESMCDDLRDEILSWFQMPDFKYWQDMNESEQRNFVNDVQSCIKLMIGKVATMIATQDYNAFPGFVEQVAVKDEIKLVVKASNNDDNYESAGHIRNKSVLLIDVDASTYTATRKEAVITPDQGEMDLVDEDHAGVDESIESIVSEYDEAERELVGQD